MNKPTNLRATHWMRGRLLLALALAGCGDKELTPEEQVEAWEDAGMTVVCWPLEDIDEGAGECPDTQEDGCCNPNEEPPVLLDDECCYPFVDGSCCGRPMMVDGEARVAPRVLRSDWGRSTGPAPELPDGVRAWLAAAWADEGSLEHASVASFARFTLDLMAFGAPPALLLDAHRAGLDEIAHAQACFALAARFGDEPVGPGPLDMSGVLPSASLAEAAAAAVIEACVGETIAALEARVRAENAQDGEVKAVLTRIAEDEARHAELGWRFVKWAMGQDQAVRPAVEAAFAEAFKTATVTSLSEPPAHLLRRFGRLPAAEARALRAEAVERVLRPARDLLLQTRRPPAHA